MTAPNWQNRTMWTGDNLDIMRGMNSESVDLVHADPPFNSNRNYVAPFGSEVVGAAFKDAWTLSDVDDMGHGEVADREPAIGAAGLTHGKGLKSYLILTAVRLFGDVAPAQAHWLPHLHCDPTQPLPQDANGCSVQEERITAP